MNLEVYNLLWIYLSQKVHFDSISATAPFIPAQKPKELEEIEPQRPLLKEETLPISLSIPAQKSIVKPILPLDLPEKEEQESDEMLRKKKKLDLLFPKGSIQYPSSLELNEAALQALEKEAKVSLLRSSSFLELNLNRAQQWQVASLLHSETAAQELQNFVHLVSKAIQEKLQVTLRGPIQMQIQTKMDLLESLSLADGDTLLIFGEEHRLSSLQQFLQQLSGFTSKAKTGYAPALFLGTYFETICLFISIDREKIQARPFKQELWNLLQQLRQA
ncbi:MAG: hypothetical protein QRY74_00330 [Chlamydia sp.]